MKIALLLACSVAWSAPPAAVNRIAFTSDEQETRVVIETGVKVQYHVERLQKPERLAIDLGGTAVNPQVRNVIAVGDPLLRRIRTGTQKHSTRIVLELAQPIEFVAQQAGDPNRLTIELRPAAVRRQILPAEPPEPRVIVATAKSSTSTDMAKKPLPGPFKKYRPASLPAVSFVNSARLEDLMRAGNIYLSLAEAIALALENNLDIEYHRRTDRPQAEADLQRAKAGQLLRFNPSGVLAGFSSATSGVQAAADAVGNTGAAPVNASGQSGVLGGFTIQAAGSAVPNLDPTFFVSGQAAHLTSPETSSFTTGTNSLVSRARGLTWGFQKSFLTGTNVQLSTGYQSLYQNSPLADINPSIGGSASLSIVQPLLQGFGRANNSRYIHVARNNLELSDLRFREQVIATVKNICDLYWDLVSYHDHLKVKQQALALAQKLYDDSKRKVNYGAIAPIDIVQAEAEVETAKLEVSRVQSQVLQQETILKGAITRSGVDSLTIADAHIVPMDTMQVPGQEPIEPLQDMVAEAIQRRPELKENRIAIANTRLTMQGVKNSMLPTLNAYMNLTNHALAGQINTVRVPGESQDLLPVTHNPGNLFVGGYGTFFSQLVSRNFPDYSVGFNLNVPLSNGAARADMAKAQLDLRAAEIQEKQQQNNVKLGVVNARIAREQARATYETAIKARALREQTSSGARRKFELGTTAFLDVIVSQRDVVTAQDAEVNARRSYLAAKDNVDFMLGRTLEANRVEIHEAEAGKVKRPPSPVPGAQTGSR